MKIRMLSTVPGSIDGISVTSYEAGQEYDLTASAGAIELADAFVGACLAEEVGAKPAPPVKAEPTEAEAVADMDPVADDEPVPAKPGRKPKAQ
jgi:hypothetical protein